MSLSNASATGSLDWLVFGEDFGRHPSTTQHLIEGLPPGDRVVWVESMGMRRPQFRLAELARAVQKLRASRERGAPAHHGSCLVVPPLSPKVFPFHRRPGIRAVNRWLFRQQLERHCVPVSGFNPIVVTTNPATLPYLPPRCRALAYLRLDDYSRLPGVTAEWIEAFEPRLQRQADIVFATARALMPRVVRGAHKYEYLPQGVDWEHFATVGTKPPRTKTLGFFGLLAEWVDYTLVLGAAKKCPSWTFEFVGPVRHVPEELRACANIRLLPAVPYRELPSAMARWDAAWIPFVVSTLTESVNPLKAREYLAAGLPTLSTPLPELDAVAYVDTVRSPEDVALRLSEIELLDTPALRTMRRDSVRADSWRARTQAFRASVLRAVAQRERTCFPSLPPGASFGLARACADDER